MSIIIHIYIFVLGLAFGSFALAMVDRMKSDRDWVAGRSECEKCHRKLAPIDLVPIFSWISTKGKCRYCKTALTKDYPLVELLTGSTFVLSYGFLPYDLLGIGIAMFILWLGALVIMSALIVFDLRWFLLPNKLVYPLIIIAGAHRLLYIISSDKSLSVDILALALSLAVSAGLFWVLHIASKGKWIGDGDVRLGVAMGLFLIGPVEAWLAIFIASLSGVVIAIPQMKKSKKALKLKVPFGPMLIIGLVTTYLFGSTLIDWYSRTFLFL